MRGFRESTTDPEALPTHAAVSDQGRDIARAMEDLLCDGYAACLQVDARIRRLDRRRCELSALGVEGQRDDDLRRLDEQREFLARCAVEARRDLADLRERFVRIGGMQAARR